MTLVTFDGERPHDVAEALRRLLPSSELRLVRGGARKWSMSNPRSLLASASWSFGQVDRREMTPVLADLARRPDTTFHFDDPTTALAGSSVRGALRVASTHNVEHSYLRDFARSQPPRIRATLSWEARKIAAEERRVWRSFDLTLACSEVDAAQIRAEGARRVEVCPNGTDAVDRVALPALGPDEDLKLVFVGSADFWPYEVGIAWFVKEVMPLLEQDGRTTLDVVGHPPAEPVHHPNVRYTGRVPDVMPYYEAAHALVIPLFHGSGTRLKAIEAAAVGRPVVSTAVGMEGLAFEPQKHYVRAETAQEFRAGLARLRAQLASGGNELEPILHAARAEAERLFWPKITQDLAALYQDALARREHASER